MVTYFCPLTYTLVLGVGNTKGSAGAGDEDEEPEEAASGSWMGLLNNDDGVYSLKPLKEVLKIGASGKIIGLAFRHIMRQAWSECSPIVKNHLNPILVIQSSQAERAILPGVRLTGNHIP